MSVFDKHLPMPLSKHEELDLLKLLPDSSAREKLITHNLRLVIWLVRKYEKHENIEDLVQIGTIGLIQAVNGYDEDKGAWITQVSESVHREVERYLEGKKRW